METVTRKLDTVHLDAINSLQNQFKEVNQNFGSVCVELEFLETHRKSLEQRKAEIFNKLLSLQQQESELLDQLKDRYGNGQINILDGTFTPDVMVNEK